jgi:hypothetical protein
MKVATRVYSAVSIIPRVRALAWVMAEYATIFGLDRNVLSTLRKGIEERQLIQSLNLYLINSSGRAVDFVTLAVDWDLHLVLANTGGKEFKVNSQQSLFEQVVTIHPVIRDYLAQARKERRVASTRTYYILTPATTQDPAAFAEALRFLGLALGKVPPWAEGQLVQMSYCSKLLPELKFTMQSVR